MSIAVDKKLEFGVVDDFKEDGVFVAVRSIWLPFDLEVNVRVLLNR